MGPLGPITRMDNVASVTFRISSSGVLFYVVTDSWYLIYLWISSSALLKAGLWVGEGWSPLSGLDTQQLGSIPTALPVSRLCLRTTRSCPYSRKGSPIDDQWYGRTIRTWLISHVAISTSYIILPQAAEAHRPFGIIRVARGERRLKEALQSDHTSSSHTLRNKFQATRSHSHSLVVYMCSLYVVSTSHEYSPVQLSYVYLVL
jgi:hypothetical protein